MQLFSLQMIHQRVYFTIFNFIKLDYTIVTVVSKIDRYCKICFLAYEHMFYLNILGITIGSNVLDHFNELFISSLNLLVDVIVAIFISLELLMCNEAENTFDGS